MTLSPFRWVTLLCCLVLPVPALGQSLFVVQAADTENATIGNGTEANFTHVASYMESIAALAHMPIHETPLTGGSFGCKQIRAALAGLSLGPSDAVVFYYSAHGFRRAADTSQLPRFICSATAQTDPDGSPDVLSMDEVVAILNAKHPGLLVAVADTCNDVAVTSPLAAVPFAALEAVPNDLVGKVHRLFVETRGYVVFSSSSAGQASWYDARGGYFTRSFLPDIDNVTTDSGTGTWVELISKATRAIPVGNTIQSPVADGSHLVEPSQ